MSHEIPKRPGCDRGNHGAGDIGHIGSGYCQFRQHPTLDILSARAWQAARAGNEWGLFRALSSATPADPWKTCSAASANLDLSAESGFFVTVSCDSWLYNE